MLEKNANRKRTTTEKELNNHRTLGAYFIVEFMCIMYIHRNLNWKWKEIRKQNELWPKKGKINERRKNRMLKVFFKFTYVTSVLCDPKSYAISLPLVLTSFNINESSSVFLLLCSLLQRKDEKERSFSKNTHHTHTSTHARKYKFDPETTKKKWAQPLNGKKL